MNRIATTLTILTAPVLLASTAEAENVTLDQLSSRLIAIESRLNSLELSSSDNSSSYSYNDLATREATQGSQVTAPVAPPAPAPVTPPAPVTLPTPKASTTYVIKDGDTLGSIAKSHEVERTKLLTANRLSEGQPIYIGETLLIPGTEPLQAPDTDSTQVVKVNTPAPVKEKSVVLGETNKLPGTYKVAKGDTLTAIARKNGTTVAQLKAANGLKSDIISLGQSLTIPAGSSDIKAPEMAKKVTAPANSQEVGFEYDNPLLSGEESYGYYTVNKGDNLYALARDFFSTMAELQRLNRLGNSTLIYPGNDLIVPTGKYNDFHNSSGVAQR
tara:strand:+ start:300 stop:1286 length:987 start_codon:yes stop_codon:yes gene_type:complete